MVDLRERTMAVYSSIMDVKILSEEQTLLGDGPLTGLEIGLAEVFAELDRRPPEPTE